VKIIVILDASKCGAQVGLCLLVVSNGGDLSLAMARSLTQDQSCTPRVSAPSTTRLVPLTRLAAELARKT
jgi:hypothetical protein